MNEQKDSKTKKILLQKILPLVLILGIIVLLCFVFVNLEKHKAEQKSDLVVQGSLKTTETDLNAKIAGIIKEIHVAEGDTVAENDVLVVIDSKDLQAKKQEAEAALAAAQGQVASAEAAHAAAEAQYQKALNGSRSQDIAQLKAAYELAEKTYQRTKQLYESNVASEADYDQANAKYLTAKEQYDMAVQGTREEDKMAAQASVSQAASSIKSAQGQVLQAQANIAEIQSYIDDTIIKAPASGTITSLNVEVGELVSSGMPLATISSLAKPWVEVNVEETNLSQIHLGDTVKVTLLAYPDEIYEGTVVRVNKKPDFATKRATNESNDFDILSYGVKVEISGIEQHTYPGMTVVVDFGKKAGQA